MIILRSLLFSFLVTEMSWAADEPFVGGWKLNPSKTKVIDQMKVERLGANKYAFDFGDGAETIAVDGTDQPGNSGTTLSVTVMGSRSWMVVRKEKGRTLLTATWTLSKDGKALTDDYTEFESNGSPMNVKYVYERTAGGSGFAGTWESTGATVNSAYVMQIRPWEGDGLSFIAPAEEVTKKVKFDGKDYPNQGPHVAAGSASSIRRVNDRTLELTDKVNGKVVVTQQVSLSADFKTLTMTVHTVGRSKPNIIVFDRE